MGSGIVVGNWQRAEIGSLQVAPSKARLDNDSTSHAHPNGVTAIRADFVWPSSLARPEGPREPMSWIVSNVRNNRALGFRSPSSDGVPLFCGLCIWQRADWHRGRPGDAKRAQSGCARQVSQADRRYGSPRPSRAASRAGKSRRKGAVRQAPGWLAPGALGSRRQSARPSRQAAPATRQSGAKFIGLSPILIRGSKHGTPKSLFKQNTIAVWLGRSSSATRSRLAGSSSARQMPAGLDGRAARYCQRQAGPCPSQAREP